jgi:DNA polymerase/3'-5' exonuclease PolX
MSDTGIRMSYPFALNLANRMVELLRPDCQRIEIAGSIRRKKETIGDIELVLISRDQTNLFGDPVPGDDLIEADLYQDGFVFSKNGPLYKQAHLASSEKLRVNGFHD